MGLDVIFRGNADATMSEDNHLYVHERFLIPWAEYQMHPERSVGYRYVEVRPTKVYTSRSSYYLARRDYRNNNREDKPLMSNGHSLELPDSVMRYLGLHQDSKMILIANLECFDLWERSEFDRHFFSITREDLESIEAQFELSATQYYNNPPARSGQHSPGS